MDHPKLAKLIADLPDFAAYMRRAFAAGREVGVEDGSAQERAKIARALTEAGVIAVEVVAEASEARQAAGSNQAPFPERPMLPRAPSIGYGFITKRVKSALEALAVHKTGVSPIDVTAWCREHGVAIDVGQARTALKVLARQNPPQAYRLQRGKYRAPGLFDRPLPPSSGQVQ